MNRRPITQMTMAFFDRDPRRVARALLGKLLVRKTARETLAGRVVETEAYLGADDAAAHSAAGKTVRNAVLWGPPGHAYVYFTYGNHWMLNVVCEKENMPGAVLIRAMQTVEGVKTMLERRSGRDTFGPGKLAQALDITGEQNGIDLTRRNEQLWIEEGPPVPSRLVTKGPRVGLYSVPEPWKSKPWRFLVKGWKLEVGE